MRKSAARIIMTIAMVTLALSPPPALAQEKTLTIALAANVNTLDPDMTGTVGTDLSVISHLYVPLIIRAPDMKLAPALAQTWRQVDDRTWRFSLVPGAHFADGEKMDAAAVEMEFRSRARSEAQCADPLVVRPGQRRAHRQRN